MRPSVAGVPVRKEAGEIPRSRPPQPRPQVEQAVPAPRPAPPPAPPVAAAALSPNDGFVMLVRSTIAAVNHANFTGEYQVLRNLAAPQFQADNDLQKLADAYRPFRDQKIDLSQALVVAPTFVKPPQREADGSVRLLGFFPSRPLEVRFEMVLAPIDGRWRFTGLAVSAVPPQQPRS